MFIVHLMKNYILNGLYSKIFVQQFYVFLLYFYNIMKITYVKNPKVDHPMRMCLIVYVDTVSCLYYGGRCLTSSLSTTFPMYKGINQVKQTFLDRVE